MTKTNWYSGVSHFKAGKNEEKRTTQSFYVEDCSWQAVCPIMTNAFKNCLMKSELRNHKSTMPPTLLPYWVMVAKDAYTKTLSEIHNSTDTIYIIACKSKKTFNLIANKNIDDYSNVYLDTKSILVELDMAKNTPRVYLLNNGKYVSHSFYGNESPSKEANTTITFNTNEIDLGKISRTEKARIKFTIWNTGKNIVKNQSYRSFMRMFEY